MNFIRCAVIPAAGMGSRMREITGGGPKELLPVAGRPVAAFALEEAALAGAETAIVVISPGKEELRRELPRHAPPGLGIEFVYQESPLGECDAVAGAGPLMGGGPFGVFYPDNVPSPPGALARAVQAARETGLDALTVFRIEPGLETTYGNSGRVDLEPAGDGWYRITKFIDKGPGHFKPRFAGEMRACGIYCAQPHYLDFIEEARRGLTPGQELTDGRVHALMLRQGLKFAAAPAPGLVYDAGNPEGYRRCAADLGRF